jgi:cytochrome P450
MAQCIIFLLAGFDTTANTLSFTCWYLAWHPNVQEELQREIDDVFGDLSQYDNEEKVSKIKHLLIN